MTFDEILEQYPDEEFLKADGFDDAVIGVEPTLMILVYDKNKMVDILVKTQDMTYEDAVEYLEFNTWSAYVGEKTPIYIEI
jgi:hypothetical protein